MHFVYLIIAKNKDCRISYVGYTNNLKKRILMHNTNKGAKSTKGYSWILIYKRYFKFKNDAMSYEYNLKNDKKKRAKLSNNENFSYTSL